MFPGALEDLVQLSQKHPCRPFWPEAVIRRFLTKLISSDDLVLDIASNGERVGAGVLVDRIQNPANQACLEFIGLKREAHALDVIGEMIHLAAERLPPNRAGFQVTLHDSFALSDAWIQRNRLEAYYESFEMLHEQPSSVPKVSSAGIEPVTESDLEELYDVLCESFKHNPDTSIPKLLEWKNNRKTEPHSNTWVLKDSGRIMGFVHLVLEAEAGEVRTIGVLPGARGRGAGRMLLSYALNRLSEMNRPKCMLTVATKNQKALELYKSLGFKVIDHYKVFARRRADHPETFDVRGTCG